MEQTWCCWWHARCRSFTESGRVEPIATNCKTLLMYAHWNRELALKLQNCLATLGFNERWRQRCIALYNTFAKGEERSRERHSYFIHSRNSKVLETNIHCFKEQLSADKKTVRKMIDAFVNFKSRRSMRTAGCPDKTMRTKICIQHTECGRNTRIPWIKGWSSGAQFRHFTGSDISWWEGDSVNLVSILGRKDTYPFVESLKLRNVHARK